MRNLISVAAIGLQTLFILQIPSAQEPYHITGLVTNTVNPRYVYITNSYQNPTYRDSSEIKDGRFSFAGITRQVDPERSYLYVGIQERKPPFKMKLKLLTDFFVEKGNTNIAISGLAYKDSILITGTKSNEVYIEFIRLKKEFEESMRKYLEVNRIPFTQVEYDKRIRSFYHEFIASHQDSYISLELLSSELWKLDKPQIIRSLLATLSVAVRNSDAGKLLDKQIENLNLVDVGQMAPDFVEKDTTGKPVSLSSYRGQYVLIDFWASWCHPCREENPNLRKAYAQLHNKNFSLLSISMDKSKSAWLKAIKEDKLPWEQVSNLDPSTSESAVRYGVKGIPQNFLIDPMGRIIAKNLRGHDLLKALDTLVK